MTRDVASAERADVVWLLPTMIPTTAALDRTSHGRVLPA
jgi:hypothetical protein